jgi:hypothetical protein
MEWMGTSLSFKHTAEILRTYDTVHVRYFNIWNQSQHDRLMMTIDKYYDGPRPVRAEFESKYRGFLTVIRPITPEQPPWIKFKR